MKRVAERTVWGGVVPTGVKLAAHTGATSEKLLPPTGNSLGKELPSYLIKLSGRKREIMILK